jgi:hypothetical protein
MAVIRVRENGTWVNFAIVPARHADLYVRYAISRGYREVEVA